MKNLPNIFLRSFENVGPDVYLLCSHYGYRQSQGWNCRGAGVEPLPPTPPVHVYRRSFLSETRL